MNKGHHNLKIALIQPRIPDYREMFLSALSNLYKVDIYVYNPTYKMTEKHMAPAAIPAQTLHGFNFLNIIWVYSISVLLKRRYNLIIIPAEVRSPSAWLLLFICKLKKIKTILWGHGISISRYLEEEKKYPWFKKMFHNLADHIWLYTDYEKKILAAHINAKKISALNNTINTRALVQADLSVAKKKRLKEKYQIRNEIVFVFCARFSSIQRRADKLLELISKLDKKKYGFIIIGDGPYKPDFASLDNVYDFGAVYDVRIKNELFNLADLYLQPAYLGLSVAEALAYGKPVLTYKRSQQIRQGVEINYIRSLWNGYIAEDSNDLLTFIQELTPSTLETLQQNARQYATENLSVEKMIFNANSAIKKLFQ